MKYQSFTAVVFYLFFSSVAFSQEIDIVPYLKQIEKGESKEVMEILLKLKKENPTSANLIFLEGVLTENGQEAVSIYQSFVEKYPDNSYADAALYRIYSYYYALGLYETASKVLGNLTDKYPDSPYIKMALSQEEAKQEEEKIPPKVHQNEQTKEQNEFNYKFTIQAGAFVKIENARGLKSELESEGIFCEMKEKNVGGTTFHVVYVGKFQNRNEAEKFLQQINSRYNLNGRIIEKEN
ncbi:SPOR domain-containing protein [Ignavibacterium sp.]|uniref:SPOR domain-containing protein n=1 Tax=Ignavibacterium sp. TaxID=2651167 RepID=UPI00307E9836